MRLLIFCFFFAFLSTVSHAYFEKFTAKNGITLWGESTFETFTPYYYNKSKKKLVQVPSELSKKYGMPLTVFFNRCDKAKDNEILINWLKNLPEKKPISHFILYLPCSVRQKRAKETFHEFLTFYQQLISFMDCQKLKVNLISFQEVEPLAIRLVEAIPELFTSITLIDAIPEITHISRFKGVRVRGYISKQSPIYNEIISAYDKLKKAGLKFEFYEFAAKPEELVNLTIATHKHWDWVIQLN